MDTKEFICDNTTLSNCSKDNKRSRPETMLHLAIKTNLFADQTPTPTRFIQNCEEVGLFQDLQNVNPFEETFRKAAESVQNGELINLEKKREQDDVLHTPNVPFTDHFTVSEESKAKKLRGPKKYFRIISINDRKSEKKSKKPSQKKRRTGDAAVNRAAASRSRQKKKLYYANLEKTNKELLEKNELLSREILQLKMQLAKKGMETCDKWQQTNFTTQTGEKPILLPFSWTPQQKVTWEDYQQADTVVRTLKSEKGAAMVHEHNYFSNILVDKVKLVALDINPQQGILKKPLKKRRLKSCNDNNNL